MQAISIIPGISRSGITLTTALNLKINKEEAINFVFLLSIPAILGAVIYEAINLTSAVNLGPVIFGTLVSAIVGVFALKYVIKLIRSDKYYLFAYYCFAVGIITILLSLGFQFLP